jgi:protein phosphatase
MSSDKLVKASLRTHQGRVRDHNEDFVTSREPTSRRDESENGWLYIVADGVGGADAGEVASQFASERAVEHYLSNSHIADWSERLKGALLSANADLRQMVADRNDHSRMATTMVAVAIRDQTAFLANVGDSRGYHWRDGKFHQVTKDQSLVAKLLEEGAITEEEAAVHPRKNVILYSLGSEKDPQIDLFQQSLEQDDILLLCSDGLTRHVSDEELAAVISQQNADAATQTLVQLANSRGGEDNISAVVLHFNASQAPARVFAEPIAASQTTSDRSYLWTYTLLLTLVQTILILLVWLWLR